MDPVLDRHAQQIEYREDERDPRHPRGRPGDADDCRLWHSGFGRCDLHPLIIVGGAVVLPEFPRVGAVLLEFPWG